MKKPSLNNLQLGSLTEKIIQVNFIRNGFMPSIPYVEEEIDMIIEKNNKILKIQVKTAYYEKRTDTYQAALLRTGHKTYNLDEIDYFVIYIYETNSTYLIPTQKIKHTKNIRLYPHRSKKLKFYSENKKQTLTDYEIFRDNYNL